MKYVAPAIVNVQSANSVLAASKNSTRFTSMKGSDTPDGATTRTGGAGYEANG